MSKKDLEFRNLKKEEIEIRPAGLVFDQFLKLLVYKDARVDMNILDETVGSSNWKNTYTRNNANCEVSIWIEEKGEWVSKENTGCESTTERKKGLASDSFKRACFNWGIGRELYTCPEMLIDLSLIESKDDNFKVCDIKYERELVTRKVRTKKDAENEEVLEETVTKEGKELKVISEITLVDLNNGKFFTFVKDNVELQEDSECIVINSSNALKEFREKKALEKEAEDRAAEKNAETEDASCENPEISTIPKETVDEIKALSVLKEKKLGPTLDFFKVSTVEELSKEQADRLIKKLRSFPDANPSCEEEETEDAYGEAPNFIDFEDISKEDESTSLEMLDDYEKFLEEMNS